MVRLFAPAGSYDPAALDVALGHLRAMDLTPRLAQPRPPRDRYYAGSTQARADELLEALADPEAEALWAVRGGSGTAQLMPAVGDVLARALRERPRWLIGFSDLTTLHGAWFTQGVMSLHGPNATTLDGLGAQGRETLRDLLFAPSPTLYPGTHAQQPPGAPGRAEGRLTGGNLTVLASLCGTQLMPSYRGAVLLLEDIDERPYRLDRAVHQLLGSGALEGLAAVVLGQLTRCDAPGAPGSAVEYLIASLAPLGVPILVGTALGHEPTTQGIIFGGLAAVDVARATLTVTP